VVEPFFSLRVALQALHAVAWRLHYANVEGQVTPREFYDRVGVLEDQGIGRGKYLAWMSEDGEDCVVVSVDEMRGLGLEISHES
jgi:hypothetical protein